MAKFRFKKLALGGTFDILHKGHKKTIAKAFHLSNRVLIGLSTDELAKSLKHHEVNPCEYRKKSLEKFLEQQGFLDRAEIIPIVDRFGIAHVVKDLDAILVSRETIAIAKQINEARMLKGLRPLKIVLTKKVNAEDGKPISSTRIRSGEIDVEGRLLPKDVKSRK